MFLYTAIKVELHIVVCVIFEQTINDSFYLEENIGSICFRKKKKEKFLIHAYKCVDILIKTSSKVSDVTLM